MPVSQEALEEILETYGRLIAGLYGEELGQGRLDPDQLRELVANSGPAGPLEDRLHRRFFGRLDDLVRQHCPD